MEDECRLSIKGGGIKYKIYIPTWLVGLVLQFLDKEMYRVFVKSKKSKLKSK